MPEANECGCYGDLPRAHLDTVYRRTLWLVVILNLGFGARLPIPEFFRYSSALIAILAVILAGKGVAAIQEAGFIAVSPIERLPQIDFLGLHPTLQGVLAQLAIILALVFGFLFNRRTTGVR